MSCRVVYCCIVLLCLSSVALGQEHRVEVLKEAPPKEKLPEEMVDQFAAEGLKVVRGSSRTVCSIWPCKKWEIAGDFEAKEDRLYPFKPGQLIGLLHFGRRGKDFRDQTIQSGYYTLRFGLQPNDGNHEGTSPTRDFLLMIPAAEDKSPELVGVKRLMLASAEAAGSSHPAMLCLQRAAKEAKNELSMRHDEEKDWWILHFSGKAVTKDKTSDLALDVIVAGHADE